MSICFFLIVDFYLIIIDKYPLLRVFETGTVRELPLKNQDVPLDLLKLFSDDAFAKSHGFWVKSLAIALFEFFDGETLAAVAAKQTSFAVSMVPLLVKVLLTTMNKHHCDSLKEAVNRFFANNFVKLTSEPMEVIVVLCIKKKFSRKFAILL